MFVGAQRLTFQVPVTDNSRAVAQRVKDKLWARFKISVAEVESTDSEVVIGIACVGIEEKAVREKLASIIRYLNESGSVEVLYDEDEVIHFDDLELERDFEKYNP